MFSRLEERFTEDDGNCETTTITRTMYEEKCFDDNCSNHLPFSGASRLVDSNRLFENGTQRSGNEDFGSEWRSFASESTTESTRRDYSPHIDHSSELTKHDSRRHNVRIVPIRKRERSPGRPVLEHIHKSRSRSAGSTSRRCFKECEQCCRIRQQQEHWQDYESVQHQYNRQSSWPSDEVTDREVLQRSYHFKESYTSSFLPKTCQYAAKDLHDERKNHDSGDSLQWKTARDGLSQNSYNETHLTTQRCERQHCQFSSDKETEREVLDAADAREKCWRINSVRRTEHRELGGAEHQMKTVTADSRESDFTKRIEFDGNTEDRRGRYEMQSAASNFAESEIYNAEQSNSSNMRRTIKTSKKGESGREGVNHMHPEGKDEAWHKSVKSGQRVHNAETFALDWQEKCRKSEEILREYRRRTEMHANTTQTENELRHKDLDRQNKGAEYCRCCGTDAGQEKNVKRIRQFVFDKVSAMSSLRRSPEFDEVPCHDKCTNEDNTLSDRTMKIRPFDLVTDGKCHTEELTSGEEVGQLRIKPKKKNLNEQWISSSECCDRDVTEAVIEPTQMLLAFENSGQDKPAKLNGNETKQQKTQIVEQTHSSEGKVRSDCGKNVSLQKRKTNSNKWLKERTTDKSQIEKSRKVTFQKDGNENCEKLKDLQQPINRQEDFQQKKAYECSGNGIRSSQPSELDRSNAQQKSADIRERARGNATEIRSAVDESNINAAGGSSMPSDEVLRVSEVPESRGVATAVHRRLIDPSEERNLTSGSQFEIVAVDFNIQRNTTAHHTEQYEVVNVHPYRLVCRRGNPITIFLKTAHPYDPYEDSIAIIFLNEASRSRAEVAVKNQDHHYEDTRKDDWEARIRRQSFDSLTVDVYIPYECAIGIWEMIIECRQFGQRTSVVELDAPIYILFNPWNTDDETYYPTQYELDEYILNPIGILFKVRSKDRWLYGQFENVCLFAAIELIHRLVKERHLDAKDLGSAVDIARALTFGINQYVLEASWQKLSIHDLGPYDVLPSLWTGSTEILMHYLKAGKRVGFGQCWCYGGLLTSLCRCIGIPCRTITNYDSAHDTNEDLTITLKYIDGEPSKDNRDSIWNFHVWNEVWMRRPGLKKSYNGWQVCDATHQHLSPESGRYQCGPFPVKALLYGDLRVPYDGIFIYGEINADVIDKFYRTDSSSRRPTFINEVKSSHNVGTKIVTNNPKMIEFVMDITGNYKEPEGSIAEREQHRHALESIGLRPMRYRRAADELIEKKADVKFSMNEFKDVEIGKPIDGFVEVINQSDSQRTIVSQIQADVVCYTGTEIANIYSAHEMLRVEAGQVRRMEIDVAVESYSHAFDEDLDIAISVTAKVEETGQNYRHREILKILKPKLIIEIKPMLALNKEEPMRIELENPFNIVLTECELKIDGTGFHFDEMPIRCNVIDAHGTMIVNTSVISKRRGLNQLIAVFSCAQLKNVRALATVRTA